LSCGGNQLVNLNVSNNTYLSYLSCEGTQLANLDVSNNTALWTLWCGRNQLTALDVSFNTELRFLQCHNNQLTSLDVANLLKLRILICSGNQLTSLDISKNSNLGPGEGYLSGCYLGINNMPSLGKVCVWTVPFPPDGVTVETTGSPNVFFTKDCIK